MVLSYLVVQARICPCEWQCYKKIKRFIDKSGVLVLLLLQKDVCLQGIFIPVKKKRGVCFFFSPPNYIYIGCRETSTVPSGKA